MKPTNTTNLLAALTTVCALNCSVAIAQTPPSDSDYYRDVTRTFVNERSGQALDSVNSVLCMIEQTKYNDESLLGAGPYRALVDQSLCEDRDSGDNSGESGGDGTSASGSKEFLNWTVTSSRSTALSPQVVTFFVHLTEEETPITIQGKLTITEGASEFNPLGAFTLMYKMTPDAFPTTLMKGLIRSKRDDLGRVVITQAEENSMPDGTPMRTIKAALRKGLTSGAGSISETSAFPGEGGDSNATFNFAYNDKYFLRSKGTASSRQCLNRKSFETSAWRYGLYNSTSGQRIEVDSGFPFNTEPDGQGKFGYIGYFGLGLPPGGDPLTNGSTVYRQEFVSGAPVITPYTLLIKDGKLKKHTRAQLTLSDLKNVPLEGFIPAVPGAGNDSFLQRLVWDGTNLSIVATASPSNGGAPNWTEVKPPTPITSQTALLFGELPLFSQALGGQIRVTLSNCEPLNPMAPQLGVACDSPNASTPVVFFKESLVDPTDNSVPALLSCFDNCPKAGPSGMDKDDLTYPQDQTAHNYTFADGILKDGANPATLSDEDSNQRFGFSSGPLFDLAANQAQLACPWDPSTTCGWLAWSVLDEFYTWETGPNSWNKFASVEDNLGDVVVFDPPLQLDFTYPATGTNGVNPAAVDQKFAGNHFLLQYSGFGALQGVPGKCFNPENPADSDPDCGKSGRRWVPAFTIPTGSLATDADDAYLIKPLEVERRMSKAALSACSGVQLEDLRSSWPNLNKDWIDPNLGEEPVLTDPPKVIAGEIQK